MRQYTAHVPAAPKGVARRQLKVNWGQSSAYVDLGLKAESVEFEAGAGAIAQLLHFSDQDELSRGERVPLVGMDRAPKPARRSVQASSDEAESDDAPVDLSRMNREKLFALAEQRKVATTGQETKAQLVALLSPPSATDDDTLAR